jgi:hypothetical protein
MGTQRSPGGSFSVIAAFSNRQLQTFFHADLKYKFLVSIVKKGK